MADGPHTLLDDTDLLLNKWFVFISACEVESRSTRKLKKKLFQGGEFAICGHGHDLKTALEVVVENGIEFFEDCFDLAIAKMRHHSEAEPATECDEEWYLIHKKYVDRHRDIALECSNFIDVVFRCLLKLTISWLGFSFG